MRADKNSACHRFIHKEPLLHVNGLAFVHPSCLKQLQTAGKTEIRGAFQNIFCVQICRGSGGKGGRQEGEITGPLLQVLRRGWSSIPCTQKSLGKEESAPCAAPMGFASQEMDFSTECLNRNHQPLSLQTQKFQS